MKVLLIAHACQVAHEGQQRAEGLGNYSDIDLRVVAPDRWFEYGKWRQCDKPSHAPYVFQPEKVRWPWAGPAQWYLHHYPRLPHILRSFKPDIIDLWEEPWGLVSAHACWLRNRLLPSAKVVSETEANVNRTHPFPFAQFRRYTLRHTDYAITRQTEGVGILRANGYTGPVKVVGNAVNAELFRPMDREHCRHRLGLAGFVIGYVGRFVEAKGLTDILDALPTCPLDVNALFVGSGPLEAALKAQVKEMGLTTRVRFLPPQSMEALPEIMNAIDVLALVSRTTATWKEQFGRIIIEAHACGTPVIGSDSGGIPEVVGKGGLIVPERAPGALAAATQLLRNAPAMGIALGRIGRKQVEERFTWKSVAAQIREVYLSCLALHSAPIPAYSHENTGAI